MKAGTKEKYFLENPAEKVSAITNSSIELKEVVEIEDYFALLATPTHNKEASHAFIFCLYTGLRWIDIKGHLITTRIIQSKTGQPVVLTLHSIAQKILELQKNRCSGFKNFPEFVFGLPIADGANKMLGLWAKEAL